MRKIAFRKLFSRGRTRRGYNFSLGAALLFAAAFIISAFANTASAQYCVTGCNSNTFINADDPNTLEYDNIVSLYHGSIVRESSGLYRVWGARGTANASNALTPLDVTPANGYTYTGDILKATGGARNGSNAQYAILTDAGLYYWGQADVLVSSSVKSGNSFGASSAIGTVGQSGTNSTGLPMGVAPADVKMLFGTFEALSIVTCDGAVYVLTQYAAKSGDGDTGTSQWHRVKTGADSFLENVVAVRGSTSAMMALTEDGKIFTWGTNAFLGGGTAAQNLTYATEMDTTAISGRIKMIGMTGYNSYYVLTSAADGGNVYALGANDRKQLGDRSTTTRTDWVRPLKSATAGDYLTNVAWISPNSHSGKSDSTGNHGGYPTVNAITAEGKLWSWGANSYWMLGNLHNGSTSTYAEDLLYMTGGLNPNDFIIAVETGGHTTLVMRQCSEKFGYIGHKANGSMGDGQTSGQEGTFNFDDTIELDVCGVNLGPSVKDLKICPDTTADLDDANLEIHKDDVIWREGPLETSPIIPDIHAVGPGTYYAFFTSSSGQCEIIFSKVIVSEWEPGDAGYEACLTPIEANNDTYVIDTGDDPITTATVFDNDTLDGQPFDPDDVDFTVTDDSDLPDGITVNPDGTVTIDPGVAPGTYTFTYQICEAGVTPPNCDTAEVTIYIDMCEEEVGGNGFSWKYAAGENPTDPVVGEFTQPGSDGGYTLDIWYLDNSFNMVINGTGLATEEIEFQTKDGALGTNIMFADGDRYEVEVTDIWNLSGDAEHPILRIRINADGSVNMFGVKEDGGELFPLIPITGLSNSFTFNHIDWNKDTDNNIVVSQNVVGETGMTGRGYGVNYVDCFCVKPGKDGEALTSSVGISTKGAVPSVNGWPKSVPNGYLVLDSAEKGFVITHMTTAERDALIPVTGMLIYNTDEKCVQMYRGETPSNDADRNEWNCLERSCND